MLSNEQIDVRSLILNSPQFGQNEIEQLRTAISKGLTSEIRQTYQELSAQLHAGDSDSGKLLAAGHHSVFFGTACRCD